MFMVIQGDITKLKDVEAIVNAANCSDEVNELSVEMK